MGLAVVGAGAWGRNLIRNFRATGALTAVCDSDATALARIRQEWPELHTTGSLSALLDTAGLDAVVIATNSSTHYALAKQALEADKHVFVEKPLAQSVAHAEALVELAARQDRVLMVGHLLRYHPAVDFLRELVQAGELGEVCYAYCQRVNLGKIRSDENALWSFGPHDVSVILDLLDAMPARVSATGQAYVQDGVEDVVFVQLTFPSGQLASIHLSWLDPHKIRRLTLVGDRKMAVFDDMESTEKVRIYDKGVDGGGGRIVDYKDALTLRFGDIHIPHLRMREPLSLECQAFLRATRGEESPRTDGADGLRVVRVLEAAAASLAAGGQPVELDCRGGGRRPTKDLP